MTINPDPPGTATLTAEPPMVGDHVKYLFGRNKSDSTLDADFQHSLITGDEQVLLAKLYAAFIRDFVESGTVDELGWQDIASEMDTVLDITVTNLHKLKLSEEVNVRVGDTVYFVRRVA